MERSEVEAVVRGVLESIGTADADAFAEHLSNESDVVLIGTDAKEWWRGRDEVSAAVRAQFAATPGMRVDVRSTDLEGHSSGDVGWAAGRARFEVPHGASNEIRFTAVLRREGGGWKVVQAHSSLGVPNDEAFGVDF